MTDDTWTRTCKEEGCFAIARGDSDYCSTHRKERKLKGLFYGRCKKDGS